MWGGWQQDRSCTALAAWSHLCGASWQLSALQELLPVPSRFPQLHGHCRGLELNSHCGAGGPERCAFLMGMCKVQHHLVLSQKIALKQEFTVGLDEGGQRVPILQSRNG